MIIYHRYHHDDMNIFHGSASNLGSRFTFVSHILDMITVTAPHNAIWMCSSTWQNITNIWLFSAFRAWYPSGFLMDFLFFFKLWRLKFVQLIKSCDFVTTLKETFISYSIYAVSILTFIQYLYIVCDPFVQFKKRDKHPWRSVF